MNRLIKFRAWNIPTKIMVYWPNVQDILASDNMIYHDRRNFEPKHTIFLQYTGLKDENGKEIYEGDIVKSGNGRVWTVKFGEFIYTMPRQEEKGYGYYICPIENELKEKGNGYLYNGVEVIGNIYENENLFTNCQRKEKSMKFNKCDRCGTPIFEDSAVEWNDKYYCSEECKEFDKKELNNKL